MTSKKYSLQNLQTWFLPHNLLSVEPFVVSMLVALVVLRMFGICFEVTWVHIENDKTALLTEVFDGISMVLVDDPTFILRRAWGLKLIIFMFFLFLKVLVVQDMFIYWRLCLSLPFFLPNQRVWHLLGESWTTSNFFGLMSMKVGV